MPGFGPTNVESPQRKMQLISVKKRGLGTPTLSGSCAAFCTITKNAVGDYTITIKGGQVFTKVPEIMTGAHTVGIVKVHAVTINSIQIRTTNVDGITAAEHDFDVLAIGSLARDLVGP